MLSFDPETHVYRWHDQPVDSVTQILKAAGIGADYSGVPEDVLAKASARGQYVEACCQAETEGRLDRTAVHPEALPYVEAFLRFRDAMRTEPGQWGRRLYHPDLGYAGTSDWETYTSNAWMTVYDVKCTTRLYPSYRLQTAAYAIVPRPDHERIERRAILWLRKDGTYKVVEHPDPDDLEAWIGLAMLHRWRKAANA